MKKKMTTVTFRGTQEQEAKLDQVIGKYRNVKGALMPVLQEAQHIYGYLPYEVQKMVSERMDVSLEEIYGVVTFYSQFILNPKGKIDIEVCMGTACYVKGAGTILERISTIIGVKSGETSSDGKYSLAATRCIGACGLAPVLTVNGDVYGRLVHADEVDPILEKYQK
jgi:NADH:ubiquinone oxidoreductase 24 kD subunit